MTGDKTTTERTVADTQPPAEAGGEGTEGTYVYEPAGIRERSGYSPLWLKLVSLGLILWGIQYAIRYWSSY